MNLEVYEKNLHALEEKVSIFNFDNVIIPFLHGKYITDVRTGEKEEIYETHAFYDGERVFYSVNKRKGERLFNIALKDNEAVLDFDFEVWYKLDYEGFEDLVKNWFEEIALLKNESIDL